MELKYDKIKEGDELPSLQKPPIEQVQLVRYAGASGDFNQIHTVDAYAKEAGLGGTIAHGMLIMGILGQMVSGFAGVKNVIRFGVGFKAMTRPGDVLTAGGTVKKKFEDNGKKFIECKLYVKDQKDEVKIDGKAVIEVD
jgi:acyl dehydratase